MPDIRNCKKCGLDRLLIEFPVYDKARGWRRHECQTCHSSRMNVHYLRNKEHRYKRAAERYAANPSASWSPDKKARINARNREYRKQWFQMILDHYGARCSCCGETEPLFLTVDHVNNDGADHRRNKSNVARMYRLVVKAGFPETFQVLCYNCNCGRQRNGGVCPHHASEGSTTIPQGSTSQARWKRPAPSNGVMI